MTPDDPLVDKKGADLNEQRFRMLEDIARELSNDIMFPTSFESVMRIRKALQDTDISLHKLATVVATDPMVSSRVLALGNSVIYNRGGVPIRTLAGAIERVGLQNVRIAALAAATKGLLLARQVADFQSFGDRLWQHSLHTAAAAYVFAKRRTKVSPDEALLAGMIHDIGAFYMIYRAAQYDELVQRPESMKHLVVDWHESIGQSVAMALGLPDAMVECVRDHDQPRALPESPSTLADIVYVANLLAGGSFEWLDMPTDRVSSQLEHVQRLCSDLGDEIHEFRQAFLSAVS